GDSRAEEAAQHEPDVGRGDGGPQLSRLDAVAALAQADQDQARHQGRRARPERRPFRAGKGQGTHPRIPCRPAAHEKNEWPDPEQNSSFQDHYLEVDYDLSDVMFVTTANTLRMPQPLMDRMEIIRLPGYTEDEKVEIAKRHLIPKQIKAHGLKKGEWAISDDA